MNEPSNDTLLEARYDFHELLQLLGAASSQVKEAYDDSSMGNIQGAAIVADDVIGTLSELEAKVSHVAATVAKWKGWAEEYLEETSKKGGRP